MAAQEILVLLVRFEPVYLNKKTGSDAGFFIEVGSHPLSLCDIPLEGDMPLPGLLPTLTSDNRYKK